MMSEKLESSVTTGPGSINSGSNNQQDAEQGRDESQTWHPSKQVKLIVAVQAFVCFAVALDSTILTTTLPTFWIATSYLLTSAIFQPPIAALADVFGRQAIMLVGRSIQGIGGGGILSVNLIILSDIIPLRQRAQYQGYLQLCFAFGSNIAPVIGGLIVQKTTWRWLFYINLPFCAISLATVPFTIRYTRPKITTKEQLLSIDWLGIILSIASTTLFLVGISWGGTEYPWSSATTLCPLLIGLAGVVLTVIYETKYAAIPFLRMSVFNNWSAIAAYACTVLMAFSVYATGYYLVLWLLAVKEMSAVMAGVCELPLGLTIVPISGLTGAAITRVGSYQWAIWLGWVLSTLGMGVMVKLHPETSTVAYVFMFICAGTGLGLLFNSLSAAIQAISPTKDVAYASSMFAFMRSLGLCLGVSIGGTIFQNFLERRLEHYGLSPEIAKQAQVHGHHDLVLAVDYNFYGTRMVTASSDHRLKVWDRKDDGWTVTDVWKAHDAEVTDVKWNGPFVGEIIGSIGEDGLLRIWQEDVLEAPLSGRRFKRIYQQPSATRVPYMSLDFKNIGTETYLAVISRDGQLTVCEPVDHDNLSEWQILWQDYLCKTPQRTEETGFRLSWHHEKLPAWPAIMAGLDRKSLSLAVSVMGTVKVFRSDKDRKFYTAAELKGSDALIRDVAWANGSMRGFDVIATASKDGYVRVYEVHTPGVSETSASQSKQATEVSSGLKSPTHSKPNQSGIGAGLAGGPRSGRNEEQGRPGRVNQEARLAAELAAHSGAVWRVGFSQMGDLLVSTGDDGLVQVWKKANNDQWMQYAEVDAIGDN
ncbi:WD40 repeat-like protein [Aureobasidium sp. EXF-12298]|nr:WD40 repeat-like protein [Aureobasidium sp. EXF-12298]KAI4750635.1 WD40 repeat-like protein [Aureobasidium sp. EXF-12344]KAI4768130.1 WD40 repeat-like protein [Aureobasidium sp. EXF-3400]